MANGQEESSVVGGESVPIDEVVLENPLPSGDSVSDEFGIAERLLAQDEAEKFEGQAPRAPAGIVNMEPGEEGDENFVSMNEVIIDGVGMAPNKPVKTTNDGIPEAERWMVTVGLSGRPDAQKSYLESRGYEVTYTKDEDGNDDEMLVTKYGKTGNVEAELFVSDLFSFDGLRKIGKEVRNDFVDALDEVVSAGLITATQAGNFAALGPYGFITAPAVSAGAEAAKETIIQAMMQKAGVAEMDPEVIKHAAKMGAIFSPLDVLLPGGSKAMRGAQKQLLKSGAKKFPNAAAKSKFVLKEIDKGVKKIAEATNQGGRAFGNILDEGNKRLLRAFSPSDAEIDLGAKGILEDLGRSGFFTDLDVSKSVIDGLYDKTLRLLGGTDARALTRGRVKGTLGPKVGQLRTILSNHTEKFYPTELFSLYDEAIAEVATTPAGRSASARRTLKDLLQQEKKSIQEQIVANGGLDLKLLGELNTSFSSEAASFLESPLNLGKEALFYRTIANAGRGLHNGTVKGLAKSNDSRIAAHAKDLLESSELFHNLTDSESVIRRLMTSKMQGRHSPLPRVIVSSGTEGNTFIRGAEPLNSLVRASPEQNLKRAIAGGVSKGKWEGPLLELAIRDPHITGVNTALATATSPKLLARNVKAFMNPKGPIKQKALLVARSSLILEGLEAYFGEDRALEMVENLDNDNAKMTDEEAQVVDQIVARSHSDAQQLTTELDSLVSSGDSDKAARGVAAFSKRFSNAVEDGPHAGAVLTLDGWKVFDEDVADYSNMVRRKSNLDKGQKARMVSAVNNDGSIIDAPKKTVVRKESITPKADKKLDEGKDETNR